MAAGSDEKTDIDRALEALQVKSDYLTKKRRLINTDIRHVEEKLSSFCFVTQDQSWEVPLPSRVCSMKTLRLSWSKVNGVARLRVEIAPSQSLSAPAQAPVVMGLSEAPLEIKLSVHDHLAAFVRWLVTLQPGETHG